MHTAPPQTLRPGHQRADRLLPTLTAGPGPHDAAGHRSGLANPRTTPARFNSRGATWAGKHSGGPRSLAISHGSEPVTLPRPSPRTRLPAGPHFTPFSSAPGPREEGQSGPRARLSWTLSAGSEVASPCSSGQHGAAQGTTVSALGNDGRPLRCRAVCPTRSSGNGGTPPGAPDSCSGRVQGGGMKAAGAQRQCLLLAPPRSADGRVWPTLAPARPAVQPSAFLFTWLLF